MTDPLLIASGAITACVYVAKTAYEVVLKGRAGANDERSRCKIADVQYGIQLSLDAQTRLLVEIKDSQQDTRDGVRDLVNISRQTR